MKNLRISLPLVNGGLMPLDYETGKELIHGMVSDDFGPSPLGLSIEARVDNRRTVEIWIPYDDRREAIVRLNEEHIE